jgi:hypothetical protein
LTPNEDHSTTHIPISKTPFKVLLKAYQAL